MNESGSAVCSQCSLDLLPVPSKKERGLIGAISLLFFGLACLVFGTLLIIKVIPTPYVDPQDSFYWFRGAILAFGGIGVTFYSIIRLSIVSSPSSLLDEKYFYRAKRHIHVDNKQAEADFAEAIRLAPNNSDYYRHRGLFYEKTNELEKAVTDFQKSLSLISDKDRRKVIEADIKRVNKLRKK
jgi:hypothetical protein